MDHWQYQTAAYAEIYKHLFKTPGRRVITMSVKFEKDTYRDHVRAGRDIDKDWNFFVSALNIFKG